jgi:hypothetical protein
MFSYLQDKVKRSGNPLEVNAGRIILTVITNSHPVDPSMTQLTILLFYVLDANAF